MRGEFGLGEAARSNIRSIKAAGIPLAINNVDSDWHRNQDSSHSEEDFTLDTPYPINFVNVNPEHIPHLLECVGEKYFQGHHNIGFWSWELPKFPEHLRFGFDYFDEIWTPSNHSAEAIATMSPIPVIKVPHSINLASPSLERSALGLPEDKFIFLFMFDFHSTFMRKNPLAVVDAFLQAFSSGNEEVLLVLKCSNSHKYPQEKGQLEELAKKYSSIHLIDGHLTREEVNGLMYHCNSYVSLHRAEGFGLTMAEAMFHGKPVIATGYSANTEFMNVCNSFLVRYELKEVDLEEQLYKSEEGNFWAQPDVDHAAALMRYVYSNDREAQKIGANGAKDIKKLLRPEVLGNKIKERLMYVLEYQTRI